MKLIFRGASSAALILGVAGGLNVAWGQEGPQQTPAPAPQTVTTAQPTPQAGAVAQVDQTAQADDRAPTDRVVVTGSLIATLPEDAPKPVEVFTADDLKNQGSPSVSEFVRSLTGSFGSDLGFGEAVAEVPTGAGFANADLRGLGPNGTLVLMNGRRLASTNGGFGADLNTIPMEALEAVEVLKDGASTTYGAGAVGGVLNFRTRRDIDAPIITVEKMLYDGSEGETQIDAQTGWVGDAGNILLSLHYGRVEPMSQLKRDFSSQPFDVNPSVYSLNAPNPGRFQPSLSNFYTAATPTATVLGGVNDLPGNTGAAATAACQAIGGDTIFNLNGSAATGTNTGCALKQFYFQDIVNEQDSYRFYGEANADISDTMEFTLSATYTKSDTHLNSIPTGAPTNRATDAAVSAACTASCQFVIPVQVQTFNPGAIVNGFPVAGSANGVFTRNPFIDDFMARTGTSAFSLPSTGALYTAANWRPFGYGGILGQNKKPHTQRERILITAGLNGEFGGEGLLGQWLNGIKYDYSAQFNEYVQTDFNPDVMVARLQNALLGYGGSGCTALDLVPTDYTSAVTFNRTVGIQSNVRPGTAGCQWFNPFSSAWPTSLATGAANPMFNSGNPTLIAGSTTRATGYANPADLIDWMTAERVSETQYQSSTFDFTWSGEVGGFELPGGSVGWAAGLQWRQTERRDLAGTGQDDPAERILEVQECPFPDPGIPQFPGESAQAIGQRGCATGAGAYFSSADQNLTDADSQTISYYAEFSLPVLDTLNLSASFRREEYNGGKITGDIWSVAGKYDITDNLYVRASYATNFRAEEALDENPGEIELTSTTPARFGSGFTFNQFTIVDPNLGVEDDTTFNAGIGYNADIGDGRLRLSADFFEITIDGEVATTGTATVYNDVFGLNTNTVTTPGSQTNRGVPGIPNTGDDGSINQFANCGANLISFVIFDSPCVTGTTTVVNLLGVIASTQNGPRRVMNGIDYAADYSHPLWNGVLGLNFTATNNLVFKTQGYDVFGIPFEGPQNRLGFVNGSLTVPLVADWRSNATIRWSNENHNVNLRANFQSGVHDERDPAFIGTGVYPSAGNLTSIDAAGNVSLYGILPEDYLDFDFTYIYTSTRFEGLEARVTVLNVTDEDPLAAQNRQGYLAGISNPRGRRLELALTKRF